MLNAIRNLLSLADLEILRSACLKKF